MLGNTTDDAKVAEEFMATIPIAPEGEFCVYGTVYTDAESADALAACYAETTRLAQLEPGCLYYCLSRDEKDPTIFHFFERYSGRKAFEEHNAQSFHQKMFARNYIKDVKAVFAKPILPAKEGTAPF